MERLTDPDVLSWLLAALVATLALVVVGLLALRARDRRTAAEERGRAASEQAALREQLAAIERRLDAAEEEATPAPTEGYVITGLAASEPTPGPTLPALPARIDGRLFADIVARETVVTAAAWTHGLRRALAPEARQRIRSAMRQEVRRSRRERRDELKQALREFRARAARAEGSGGEDAA
jgi:hypothetical protein